MIDTPSTHEKLLVLLDGRSVTYRLIEHAAEGRSEHISRIRGNHPAQALKALVVSVRGGGHGRRTVLAVVPGNRALDMKGLLATLGAQKGRFAPPELASQMTGCVMGAVPPFSFRADLVVLADPAIRDNAEVVFNAGRLDRSIFMAGDDYVAIADPLFAGIATAE